MRVLVATNMYPSAERPEHGRFVQDQVEALRSIDGLEVELHFVRPGGLRRYLAAVRELRSRFGRRDLDVVHAHYGLTGWPALALRQAPHVVTYHGTDLAHPRVRPLSRALARLVALPATVSASLARSSFHDAGRARRIAVLPCGVDLDRFQPRDRREARRRLGLDPAGRYLLFPADPGRPEKRHRLAAALAEATGAELLTYSSVHPDDVPDHVNAANAVVVTSEREGFGLAPLEALACDVPVLATDVGIAPLALLGIAGALCAPFDLERWAAAAGRHLDAPDPRVAGRLRASLFDRRRMAERVASAYRDVVAEAEERRGARL